MLNQSQASEVTDESSLAPHEDSFFNKEIEKLNESVDSSV